MSKINNNCPNCNKNLWLYNEQYDIVYCFYCHYIWNKEKDSKIKRILDSLHKQKKITDF